jgi:hypothetical protein
MSEIVVLIIVALGGWIAFDALRARGDGDAGSARSVSGARVAISRRYRRARVLASDETEGLSAPSPNVFVQFSDDGVHRRAGHVVLLGARLESLQLDPYRIA